MIGLGNTGISTVYAQKSSRDTYTGDQEIGEGVHIVAIHPKKYNKNARQNTLLPSLPAEWAGGTFIKQTSPLPLLEKEAEVFALRRESPVSSSGMKVLSVLENTDQRYAL